MKFIDILKGVNGEPEIIRAVGALGVLAYILGALVFQGWAMARGEKFDVVSFCAAFPAGLAVAYGAIAGAAALKDRNAAVAKTVADTGAMPSQTVITETKP